MRKNAVNSLVCLLAIYVQDKARAGSGRLLGSWDAPVRGHFWVRLSNNVSFVQQLISDISFYQDIAMRGFQYTESILYIPLNSRMRP